MSTLKLKPNSLTRLQNQAQMLISIQRVRLGAKLIYENIGNARQRQVERLRVEVVAVRQHEEARLMPARQA